MTILIHNKEMENMIFYNKHKEIIKMIGFD